MTIEVRVVPEIVGNPQAGGLRQLTPSPWSTYAALVRSELDSMLVTPMPVKRRTFAWLLYGLMLAGFALGMGFAYTGRGNDHPLLE